MDRQYAGRSEESMLNFNFLQRVQQLREEWGPAYPITANTTAHFLDEGGESTLETIAAARNTLDGLVEIGLLRRGVDQYIGGDNHHTYEPLPLVIPA